MDNYRLNKIKLFQVTLLIMLCTTTFAQNLVPNPSFEKYKELPCYFKYSNPGNKEYFNAILEHWELPTTGSSDVYSLLVPDSCETYPSLFVRFGTPSAQDGNNMVGITIGVFNRPQNSPYYREYIQVKLNEKLIPGQRYITGFYHTLPSFTLASDNLGMLFTPEKVSLDTNGILNFKPQVNSREIQMNRMQWKLFCKGFVAENESEFLTIGSFFTDEETKFAEVGPFGSSISYYLIDSVFVEKFSDPFIPNIITPNIDTKNDLFYIEGIDKVDWELIIFNRWGSQIYFSGAYQNDWGGKGHSPGVYYYHLKQNEIGVAYKGTLNIIL